VLLNPAHGLVGVGVENLEMAKEFVAWLVRTDGGQEAIEKFEVNGMRLYSRAASHYDSDLVILADG
jgi:ABC-type tungstate transport system permease subunit